MRLTPAQSRALSEIGLNDGRLSPWCLGTRTCERLRTLGLVEGDKPFRTGWRDNGVLRLTEAGRAALARPPLSTTGRASE